MTQKVNKEKKKLTSLEQEAGYSKTLRKVEEKKTEDARQEIAELENKFKKFQDKVKKARLQLKKLEKKKEEYVDVCARYEEKVLKFATDLHTIENHLRKIDKSLGHNRTFLRRE